ncbi:MAG: glycosyltransferase family 2 protein, partial [Pirellulaceae bacterium]
MPVEPANLPCRVNSPDHQRIADRPPACELMPLVSVCMITYNHAPYIARALDSVICQETSFPFEICLGEDESSDGTREICEEYARRYPDLIRMFCRSRNDVIYVDGHATGRFNLLETLKSCRGKYIALLEGDDYWCHPQKL